MPTKIYNDQIPNTKLQIPAYRQAGIPITQIQNKTLGIGNWILVIIW
jgi:hypothetical protein